MSKHSFRKNNVPEVPRQEKKKNSFSVHRDLLGRFTTPSATCPAVEKGDNYYHRGLQYASGEGLPRSATNAVAMFYAAADAGHPMAMVSLAICYQDGFGVEQDNTQAVSWLEEAIELGNELAQNLLYCMIISNGRKSREFSAFLGLPYTLAE